MRAQVSIGIKRRRDDYRHLDGRHPFAGFRNSPRGVDTGALPDAIDVSGADA
jgi:hypothetical protein